MLPLLACAASDGPAGAPFDDAAVEVVVSEDVVTVATVTWGDDEADAVRVEYGPTVEYGKVATGEGGRARLFGMPESSTWHFRVVAERDGATFTGEDHTVTTGVLPAGVPEVAVVTPGDPGGYVLTSWLQEPSEGTASIVIDAEGNVVWYQVPTWGVAMASKVSADGKAIVSLISSHDELDLARIVRVSPEGVVEEELAVPLAHHDFLEVPHAKYAVIAGEIREVDGEPVVGDRIVEIAEDGTERVVWNAFDHFPVEENDGFGWMAYPLGADWTHANSLVYDADTDTYTVSLYMQRCIVRVARETGESLWTMCGEGGGSVVPDVAFGPQHSLELTAEGLQFFDNAYEGGGSRLVAYAIDGQTATRSWEWAHPEGVTAMVLGDVHTLPDGRVLSSWGEWRDILVTRDDQIEWQVEVVDWASVAQVERFDGF
ncbi:MAG: aryl-sulfate sulfotransferase [Myxococcota bacterium]